MPRDGFREKVVADWPATGMEIAMQGRVGKSKPVPSRLSGIIEPIPFEFRFSFSERSVFRANDLSTAPKVFQFVNLTGEECSDMLKKRVP